MKRYIILTAMLVLALGIRAQNTNPGRATRTSNTAVKEKKDTEVIHKAETTKAKSTERNATSSARYQNSGTKTNSETRTRTSSSAENRKPATYRSQERTKATNASSPSKVRIRTNENNGVRNRAAGSERSSATTVNRTRAYNGVASREYIPRNEKESVTVRKTYSSPERRVVTRTVRNINYIPKSVNYRRTYYPYHVPPRVDIIWSVRLYNEYRYIYPHYNYWYYPVGYRIHTVSAYDAYRYVGEFARIYGKVYDTWYSYKTDEYYLYFGEPYPYQDFAVIIDGRDARRFSRRPERYFTGRHIAVTGVVSVFEGKPEMLIKRRNQIDLYF